MSVRASGRTVTRMALVIASAVAGASCVLGPRDGGESLGRTALPIVGGDADPGDTAVVALLDTANGSLCSGTLVAPNLVLTAAHCVDGIAAGDLRVLVGSATSAPDQTIDVASVAAYPTYTSEASGIPGGVDLGIVTLATALTIIPIPVSTTTTDAALTGASVTVVGYGADDGTDGTGSGTRRAVSLPVAGVCTRTIQAGGADTNACAGDSGGAVLLGGRLVGVVSGGELGCHGPTTFMRTDAHALWIAAAIAGNAVATCPACVAPDSSCGAATETNPARDAGTGPEEDATSGGGGADGGDDAGTSAVASTGGRGCQAARGARGTADGAAILALGCWLGGRRRRRNAGEKPREA